MVDNNLILDLSDDMWLEASVDGFKPHILPKWLSLPITQDLILRSQNIKTIEYNPIDSIFIDYPGFWIQNQPIESIKLDSLVLEVSSHNFSIFTHNIQKYSKVRISADKKYHKIKTKFLCLVLSEEQYDKLNEYCKSNNDAAEERANKFFNQLYSSK